MVEKIFWHLIDIAVVNSWIIFRTNNPESSIGTQLKFCIELSRQLVQPLLDLRASPECPPALQRGRRPLSVAKRLIGKHFPYKSSRRGRCVVCYRKKDGGSSGKRRDTKTSSFWKKCDVYVWVGNCFEVISHTF